MIASPTKKSYNAPVRTFSITFPMYTKYSPLGTCSGFDVRSTHHSVDFQIVHGVAAQVAPVSVKWSDQ